MFGMTKATKPMNTCPSVVGTFHPVKMIPYLQNRYSAKPKKKKKSLKYNTVLFLKMSVLTVSLRT